MVVRILRSRRNGGTSHLCVRFKMGKGWLRVESKLEGTGFVRYFVIVIIVLHARQWLWWWSRQQWHTGEDTEYPELPPSRKRFIQIMMMPMIQLLFHLCPLPFPSLHLPLIPHPPLLLRPSKPLLLVVIPLFLLLSPNLNNMINIRDPR